MSMLVKQEITVVGQGDDAGHYHKLSFEGIMGKRRMQDYQGGQFAAMMAKADAEAGVNRSGRSANLDTAAAPSVRGPKGRKWSAARRAKMAKAKKG